MVTALDGVSLSISAGEMIAIMGASGSGKSTLMNILGCLDRPTSGSYEIEGGDVATLDSDALAKLRRERFGFIFQRYHLLSHLDALGNVEIPGIYAGYDKAAREQRSASLLSRLGMTDRSTHHPNQLSGGQQQRVSIARALMNGGEIILADEPSGALDQSSGREVMTILRELHEQGHTVIIVTHDQKIAAEADRTVEISDGRIVRDTGFIKTNNPAYSSNYTKLKSNANNRWSSFLPLIEATKMAIHAMTANRIRSMLTMLGIVIGITSVVSIVALSSGAKKSILKTVNELAGNSMGVYPGGDIGDDKAASVRTLTTSDLLAISALPGVLSAKPEIRGAVRIRKENHDYSGTAIGGGTNAFKFSGVSVVEGRDFSQEEVRSHAQVVVLNKNLTEKLFSKFESKIGKVILVGSLPCTIIGVTGEPTGLIPNAGSLEAWIPYTTAGSHLFGRSYFDSISVKANEGAVTAKLQNQIQQLLKNRHIRKDFYILNFDSQLQKLNNIVQIMTVLLSIIAAISLVVGGVGVMNIMLVSVTERHREIGIRMAVGARQTDVQNQFLIESVTMCLIAGIIGISITYFISIIINLSTDLFEMEISFWSVFVAFFTSTLLGVLFGFLPARKASQLDPIEALARD